MKCFTDSAIELTWPGVPVTACASMRPFKSNTPAERSPHSRTIGLKAVRDKLAQYAEATGDANLKPAALIEKLAAAFRAVPVPVIGRIAQGALIFDLRCLEDEALFAAQLDDLKPEPGDGLV